MTTSEKVQKNPMENEEYNKTEAEEESMGLFEFLYKLSYRPPTVIFIILGFLLTWWGWNGLYLDACGIHFGNLCMGFVGVGLISVAVGIEIQIRRGIWKNNTG